MPGESSIVMCTETVVAGSRTGVGGTPPAGGPVGRGEGGGEGCLPSSCPWRGLCSPEDTRKVAECAEYGSAGGERVQEQGGCSGAGGYAPPHVSCESAPELRMVGRALARTS